MIDFTGSQKQCAWAKTVYRNLSMKFDGAALPTIPDAGFWISVRSVTTLQELRVQASQHIAQGKNPFMTAYPRYEQSLAIQAIRSLPEPLALLDVETTGLAKRGEICEIAIVEYPSRKGLFSSLVKPFNPPARHNGKAMEKNGITWEELATAPTLAELWEGLIPLLTGYSLAAFNADFDIPMLRYSAYHWHIISPRLTALCLMKLSTALLQLDFYPSLDETCIAFSVDRSPYGETHRALADTLVLCDLLDRMKEAIS